MVVAVGQVQVVIDGDRAQIDFPIGDAKFSLKVSKLFTSNLWVSLSVNGSKLFSGAVQVGKDDAQAS